MNGRPPKPIQIKRDDDQIVFSLARDVFDELVEQAQPKPLLITYTQACEMLSISRSFLRKLIDANVLQKIKVAGACRVRYRDVLKLAKEKAPANGHAAENL